MQTTTVEVSEPLKEVLTELNNPQTADALVNLLRNARTLDALLTGVDGFLRRGEEIADNVGASIREFAPAASGNGSGSGSGPRLAEEVPELVGHLPALARTGNRLGALAEAGALDDLLEAEKLAALRELSNKLVNPITLGALAELIENAGTLAFLARALHDFLARGEELADNIGTAVREFRPQMSEKYAASFAALVTQLPDALPTITENLPPLLEKAPILMRTTAKLGDIAESEGIQAFLNSGMLTPELVGLLGDIGQTTVRTNAEFRRDPKPVTLFGLLGATKDEDVQRGLGFLIALAKNIGKTLKD